MHSLPQTFATHTTATPTTATLTNRQVWRNPKAAYEERVGDRWYHPRDFFFEVGRGQYFACVYMCWRRHVKHTARV